MLVDDNRVTGGGIMCPGIGCGQRSRMVPAALHRRLEGEQSGAHHTQHIRVSFVNGLADHVKLGHVVSPEIFVAHADHVQAERFWMAHITPDRGPRAGLRIAIREFDEVQVVLNHIVAEGGRIDIHVARISAGRLACDAGEQSRQRLGLEVLAQAEIFVETDLIALRIAGTIRHLERPHRILLASRGQRADGILPAILIAGRHTFDDAAAGESQKRWMQRLNGLHQIAAQLAVTPFRVARAPIVRIHELHQIQIERGAFAGVNGDTQLAVIGVQSGYVGVEPVPAVTADDDGTIRRIRTDRNAGILRIGPIVLPQTGLFRIVKRIGVHDIRQSSDTGERQAVPIDHADGQLGPPMNRTYRETDGIGVVGDDGERGLAPVVAASVIAEVFQICRAGFGRNIGRDASVSAMCVNWRGGAVGGHPLAVNPAYLTAKAGGGTVDEIPETQGISLCTPPFGTGHTPRVMVEINAVKTVVVHHVGVQPAIRTMVDVLEEHAVQSPACVMGGASHANPHHGFDCRGNGAER